MSFSFNLALTTAVDRIRQRIGDVDATNVEVQDETITAYLTQGMTERRAAARLCRDIAAKYARVADVNLDNQLTRASDIYKHYIALAVEIEGEERAATASQGSIAGILVGGIGDCRGPI